MRFETIGVTTANDSVARPPRSAQSPARDWAQADDTALVAAVGAGSMEAFAALVARHRVALHRQAVRLLGDPHEAEDVVQDAFARLWQHAAAWQPSGAGLVGWLHRVTMNLCFDRKRRFRVITIPDLPEMIDEAPLADSVIEAAQATAQMAAALRALPDRHRAALMLCYFEGLSNAAAADALNLHIKAMESLLFRARRQLRDILITREVGLLDLVGAGS